ncbi:MAG: patatin-like phospholipase family protein [Cohaesibacter sp.]|nr:patatin-like phospholipase family protein [Cohaesibacter sp.]MCV6600577.1 patatin-like phospholipase family protein [Cohaesibacter sp.]
MSEPTIAVAFGGGGARGLSHIWIMDALDELGVKPVAISGTSIGAIASSLYALGMSGKDLHDHILSLFGKPNEVLSRFWQMRPKSFSDWFEKETRFSEFDAENVIEAFLPEIIDKEFADLIIPASFSATNYFTGQEVVFKEGNLQKAVAASMAIPALFKPVDYEGQMLVDGACANPMPVDHVRDKADLVIAVDVVGLPLKPEKGHPSQWEMGLGSTQLLMQTIQREKMRHDKVDILIHPRIGSFRVLDFLKAKEILEASKGAKEDVKRALEAKLG